MGEEMALQETGLAWAAGSDFIALKINVLAMGVCPQLVVGLQP